MVRESRYTSAQNTKEVSIQLGRKVLITVGWSFKYRFFVKRSTMKTFQIEIAIPQSQETVLVFLTGDKLIKWRGFKNVVEVDKQQIVFSQPIVSIEEVPSERQTGYAESFPEER